MHMKYFTIEIYNSGIMATPNWLTEDYIVESLRKFHNDESLKLKEIEFKPAFGKGENFGGVLTRVNVKYETKRILFEKLLLVKSSLEDDELARQKMEPYDIFNREISIYEHVLPKLNALLKEIDDEDQLFATALHADYKNQALIFEDLSERGFVMASRIDRLDLAHVELILRKIAKMHATSAVLNERSNQSLESYDRGFFNQYTNSYSTFFVASLNACARYLSGVPEQAKYAKKLYALEPYYMEIGKKCFAPTPGHVNVLNHGDLWTNNVMFRYESGVPKDVILIDFQYSFWGSPSLDLHHFFNTSLKEDLRSFRQEELMQNYHEIFSSTLKKLNYQSHPVPSLRIFRLHAEAKRFFAVHCSCAIQPVMINEDSEDADFNALVNTDERAINFKRRLYKNPEVQNVLKNILPIFDRRGLLEIDQCA